jgi:hypothetical protein
MISGHASGMTSDISLEQGAPLTTRADYWSTRGIPELGVPQHPCPTARTDSALLFPLNRGTPFPGSADEAEDLLAGVTQIGVG